MECDHKDIIYKTETANLAVEFCSYEWYCRKALVRQKKTELLCRSNIEASILHSKRQYLKVWKWSQEPGHLKSPSFWEPAFGFRAGTYVIELEITVNIVVVWFLLFPQVGRNLFHLQHQVSSFFHVFLFCHIAMQWNCQLKLFLMGTVWCSASADL